MRGFVAVAIAGVIAGAVGLLAAGTAPSHPALSARLLDAERHALKKEASVEVEVSGFKLVDPSSVKERPEEGEGHLHYQVDAGPVVATTATKLSFHKLTSGKHEIKVALAANDHLPVGPAQVLRVVVP